MKIFRNRIFLSVAFGHLSVDLLNGGRSVLLTFLSGVLNLSNAAIGFYAMLYQISAALVQPLFGYLTDRFGARWVVSGGILWMGSFYALAMLSQPQWTLYFLILGSIGSGAFHPAGTSQATLAGSKYMGGQEAATTSYFFLFGEMGYFFGPILAGTLIEFGGLHTLLILSALTLPVSWFAAKTLILPPADRFEVSDKAAQLGQSRPSMRFWVMVSLVLVAGFQAWTQQNMNVFLPKYLSDLGQPSSLYGLLAGLFVGGSAVGIIVGGRMADRFGKPQVIFSGMMLGIVPMLLIPSVGVTAWLFILASLAGFLTGSTYSAIIVLAQRLIPGGRGFASGLILGFIFTSGAVGTWASGWLADQWGTMAVFYFNALLCLITGLLSLVLWEQKPALFRKPAPAS